ncbi:hypothetical protein Terro_0368 [Terriglobus roseus DSM 18391]|uniref:Uncharacterized protein n=1 Tax=Terriglobus roseus (strain DSM 18391 / NRRL B-41598 / KBS 63) TaxID=926566 RepID=I3ZBU9_TERRK|nr:DUF5522 domain-containing protein [Terriglobus roseus]AFL86717.1 hypothetical protein Terro_0368 [Terriglobus roseus DSM 18391]
MTDPQPVLPDEDTYYDGPFLVFTASYLRKRGTCCGNGCRHCPYDENGEVVPGKGERNGTHGS